MLTKMISLDTSSSCSGWALWEDGMLTEHGIIDLKYAKDSDRRLDLMCGSLISLLNSTDPDIVVIEMTVVSRNVSGQRLLSEIVGVVRGWCMSQHERRFFYRLRPTEWRRLVREEGEVIPRSKKNGLKEWDISKASDAFGFTPETDDEADAALIGWAYIRLCEEGEAIEKEEEER